MKAKVGDYFIGFNKQLYRIVDVYTDKNETDILYDVRGCHGPENWKCINAKYLDKIGKIVPEESLTEMMGVLYGE